MQEIMSQLTSLPLNTLSLIFMGLVSVWGLYKITFSVSDRYVLTELLKPFIAGVVAFMIIMISNTLYIFMELIVKSNIGPDIVGKMLLYSLPAIIVVTLPVAYMFATLLALGRLGRDSEIIAMRACGVSLSRIIMPVIVLSLLISSLGFWIQEELVPWANRQTVEILKDMVRREPLKALKEKVFVEADGRNFYVNEIDREKSELTEVYVLDKTRSAIPQVIAAQKAVQDKSRWILSNGILRKLENTGFIEHEIRFERMEIEMDIKQEAIFPDQPSVREMSSGAANRLIEQKKQQGQDTRADELDLHTKFSLPLATFFTILLAAPVGIIFSKMGNYFGVAISIALVFVWYMTYSIFTSLGKAGTVDPLMAAWVQNIAFGSVGSLLLMQLSGVKIYRLVTWPFWALLWPFMLPVRFVRWIIKRRRAKTLLSEQGETETRSELEGDLGIEAESDEGPSSDSPDLEADLTSEDPASDASETEQVEPGTLTSDAENTSDDDEQPQA